MTEISHVSFTDNPWYHRILYCEYIEAWTVWVTFHWQQFKIHFLERMKFAPDGPMKNKFALVQVMFRCQNRCLAVTWTNDDGVLLLRIRSNSAGSTFVMYHAATCALGGCIPTLIAGWRVAGYIQVQWSGSALLFVTQTLKIANDITVWQHLCIFRCTLFSIFQWFSAKDILMV